MGALFSNALYVSLPLPPGTFFPQVADGKSESNSWRTSFLLTNRSTQTTQFTLSFFSDNGTPLAISVKGQRSDHFALSIPPLGALKVETDGTDPIQTGWAQVDNGNVTGTGIFSFYSLNGKLLSSVGSPSSFALRSMSLLAESHDDVYTGIALANPDPIHFNASTVVTLALRDRLGAISASTTVTLTPNGHLAKYLGELFPSTAIPDGFIGRLDVTSDPPVAALTLRQQAHTFTSSPVVP